MNEAGKVAPSPVFVCFVYVSAPGPASGPFFFCEEERKKKTKFSAATTKSTPRASYLLGGGLEALGDLVPVDEPVFVFFDVCLVRPWR